MKLRKLTTGDYFLIIANLIPVYGVWFEGWNAIQVFLVFCLETVIIGGFNVLKMACVTLFVKPRDEWNNRGSKTMQSGFFFIIFFIIHYGFFVFVQTQLFFGVVGLDRQYSMFGVYRNIPKLLGTDGQLLLLIFIIYYTLETFYNFFLSGTWRTISMGRLMFQPYGRIFIQQFVVIVGSMFLVFGLSNIFILVLVLVKIGFELFINVDGLMKKAEENARLKVNGKNDQVNN